MEGASRFVVQTGTPAQASDLLVKKLKWRLLFKLKGSELHMNRQHFLQS